MGPRMDCQRAAAASPRPPCTSPQRLDPRRRLPNPVPDGITGDAVCFVDSSGNFGQFLPCEIGKLEIRFVSSDKANDVLLLHMPPDRLNVCRNVGIETR